MWHMGARRWYGVPSDFLVLMCSLFFWYPCAAWVLSF
jgi:hypothetical protein